MRRLGMLGLSALLCAAPLLASGADAPALRGRYANRNGAIALSFLPDGTLHVGGPDGPALPYTVNGQTLTVQAPRGPQSIAILDEDTLQTPDGFRLLRNREYSCRDADGPIGNIILTSDFRVLLREAGAGPQSPTEVFGTYAEDGDKITLTNAEKEAMTYTRKNRSLTSGKIVCNHV